MDHTWIADRIRATERAPQPGDALEACVADALWSARASSRSRPDCPALSSRRCGAREEQSRQRPLRPYKQ